MNPGNNRPGSGGNVLKGLVGMKVLEREAQIRLTTITEWFSKTRREMYSLFPQ